MTTDVWHHSLSYDRWSPACGIEHRRGIDFQTFDPIGVTCEVCAATPWVAKQKATRKPGAKPRYVR